MLQSPENLLKPYPPRRRDPFAGRGGWFDLDDWVGPSHPSGRADVAKIEAILANSGDFPMERFQGPTGYWGGALDAGIRAYQKRNSLEVDGALRPGGPTISHMRNSFADLLDGHEPPTVEEIDAHQNAVGDGAIVWRKPDVSFAGIRGLPEIDYETDSSNARLVRAMAKTGDFLKYAPLLTQTIEESGLSGVAAVSDVVSKFDAAEPGKGGQLARAVADGLSPEARNANRIELPDGQPLGTKYVAASVAGIVPLAVNAVRALGPAIGGGLATKFAIDAAKTFGSPPLIPPDDPTRTRPGHEEIPTQIAPPTSTGNPAEKPHPPNVLVNVPPISDEERKGIVKGFLDGFTVEYGYADGTDDKRGGPKTVELNNVVARACEKAIGESRFPELIKQLGGSSLKGEEKKYQPEKRIDIDDNKYRLPDYLMGKIGKGNKIEHAAAINTVTTRADGSPTLREQRQLDDLVRSKVIRFVDFLGKVDADGDPQDLFDAAYKKCVEGVRRLEAEIEAELEAGKQERKE